MKKIIKSFANLTPSLQEEVLREYGNSSLKRYPIVYKGKQTEGIVFVHEDLVYLIPLSTLLSENTIEFEGELDDDILDDDLNDLDDEG